jgi:hypothetical protein
MSTANGFEDFCGAVVWTTGWLITGEGPTFAEGIGFIWYAKPKASSA